MTLRRTSSGLLSLHIFYRVDVIVFCEGGQSVAAQDVTAMSTDARTLDTIFWSSVVAYLSYPKTYHFKSVGSKTTLLTVAEDAERLNIKTISFCIDGDYDQQLGHSIGFPRVARTEGYSWESDVLTKATASRLLVYLVGGVPPAALSKLTDDLSRLEDNLHIWTEIDISLKKLEKPSVFDRKKITNSMDWSSAPPGVAQGRLRAHLVGLGYKRRPNRVVRLQNQDILRVCFGKLISRMVYHLVLHHANNLMPGTRIDYDNFMRMAISETTSQLALGTSPLIAHYTAQQAAFC